MALKHDEQGFLIGEPINIDRAIAVWNEIRNDIRAILTTIVDKDNHQPAKVPLGRSEKHPVHAAPREALSSTVDRRLTAPSAIPISIIQADTLIDKALVPLVTPETVALPAKRQSGKRANVIRERDATGRFVKKISGKPATATNHDRFVKNTAADENVIQTTANKLISAMGNAGGGMEEADPAIKAFNEVAQPLARGYETILGGNREQRRKETWFRRIFGELKLFRKEESIFNKSANRSLKNIEDKSFEVSGGDNSSWLRRYILPFLAVLLGPMIASISGLGDRISQAWDETWAEFKALPEKIIDEISSGFEALWNSINGFFKEKFGIDIEAKLKPVVETGKKAVNKIKQGVDYVINETAAGSTAKRAYHITEAATGSVLEKVMPKGYRHKALFGGIKGGGYLSKNGTYTDAEAQRVRALKTSAANTSANVKGGMPIDIQDKISAQAKRFGLDPVMMQKYAAMESGGNPNAISKTGAIGLFQFTGKTASSIGIKNRFDIDQNIEGAMKLTSQNIAALKKAGLPVTEENLYMMFQLSPKSAKEIIRGAATGKLKSELSASTKKEMNLNHGRNSKTASDYIAANKRALDSRHASVVTTTSTPITEINIAASPINLRQSQIAFAPAPAAPKIAAPQTVAEAPQVTVPLASDSRNKPFIVTSASQDVGQDVKDRRIAHIVTGGLSN